MIPKTRCHRINTESDSESSTGQNFSSPRAVTGRRWPHSGKGEDFLTGQPGFFYENGCNSGTESRKIDPKVGNEQALRGLQTGR